MFKYSPIENQARELQKQNAVLQQQLNEQAANVDYIAMMTDVDLPEEEINEEEVEEDEQ